MSWVYGKEPMLAAARDASKADEKADGKVDESVASKVVMWVVSRDLWMGVMRAVEMVGEMVD